MKLMKLIAVTASIAILTTQFAYAKRIGGGRSYGMQRNIPQSNYTNFKPQPNNTPIQPQVNPQPRQGMGAGTAAVLGAAAGAAGGYMLGKSMSNNNNASNTQVQEAGAAQANQSNIPWGTIGILGILLLIGLVLFKRKSDPQFNNNNNFNQANGNNFNIPNIGANNNQNFNPNIAAPQVNIRQPMEKLPDGVETIYFLRQAKGMFLHIQSMNNPDNVDEIAKYMTPELYQEIKQSISSNDYISDFQNLDSQLLTCDLEDKKLIASVRFFGLVSEDPQQPAKPFSEVWNFIKSDATSGKWMVSGIQQD